jgi:hypothetical protein
MDNVPLTILHADTSPEAAESRNAACLRLVTIPLELADAHPFDHILLHLLDALTPVIQYASIRTYPLKN